LIGSVSRRAAAENQGIAEERERGRAARLGSRQRRNCSVRFDDDHLCAGQADREASVGSGRDACDWPIKATDDRACFQLSKIAARGEQYIAVMKYQIVGRTRLHHDVRFF
jgi:hypothetical protein